MNPKNHSFMFILFVILGLSMQGYSSISKGPWINNVQTNSAVIMWETSSLPIHSYVEYGLTTSYGSASSNSIDYNVITTYYIHEVKITNLTGNSTFHFKIHSDGDSSIDGEFRTPPPPGTDMKIVIFGDNRESQSIWAQICGQVNTLNPELVVHVGDYVMQGNEWNTWGQYLFINNTNTKNMFRTHSFIGVPGNHEVAETYHTPHATEQNTLYYHYFSTPTHPANDDPPEAYYSYIWGDIHFIMADVNDEAQVDFRIGSSQYNWLENELLNNTSKWVINVQHTPILSTSYHGQWTAAAKGSLRPLFEQYVASGGRFLSFNGDDHNWQFLRKKGVNYICTGGSGADLYSCDYNPIDLPYAIVTNTAYSFTYLQITNNANNIYMQALYPDGSCFYSTNFEYKKMSPYETEKIIITEPNGEDDVAYNNFNIQYEVESPLPLDENSDVSLYYTRTSNDNMCTFINNIPCQKYEGSYQFLWNTSAISSGDYYITGILSITNGKKITNKSPFPITVGKSNSVSLQAYPTPFVPGKNVLRLNYTANPEQTVSFLICDILGRQIRTLTEPDAYGFSWDGKDDLGQVVPKGIYIVKMKIDNKTQKVYQKVVVK